ncbi:helix-turn-helix domain-containing protein [Treponema primitia]|uniref:helix-turn-helix domain-containing protein n=1 Tax=Treponema primitia TaxID=88058 RepID=UPI0039810D05
METLLTIAELAAAIKLAEQTIRRYVLHKEIPFHKVKKVVRFRPSEIEAWVNAGGNMAGVDADDGDDKERDLFDFPPETDKGQ